MEDCVSLCICKFTKKDVGNNVFSFQQNSGYSNIGVVYSNIGGGYSNKTRQNKEK
jgi:hypothetical protein